jgi:hypothetical protein
LPRSLKRDSATDPRKQIPVKQISIFLPYTGGIPAVMVMISPAARLVVIAGVASGATLQLAMPRRGSVCNEHVQGRIGFGASSEESFHPLHRLDVKTSWPAVAASPRLSRLPSRRDVELDHTNQLKSRNGTTVYF